MEESKFKELLEKYWNAETTLAEEKLIEEHIVSNDTEHAFKDFFVDRNAAKKISCPAAGMDFRQKTRKFYNLNLLWIGKIAAVLLVAILSITAMLVIKQKAERATRVAAQKQLEADLTLMFNAVNDSYSDLISSAHYLIK